MYKNYAFEIIIHGVIMPKENFKIIATQSIGETSQFLLWLLYDQEGTHLIRRKVEFLQRAALGSFLAHSNQEEQKNP